MSISGSIRNVPVSGFCLVHMSCTHTGIIPFDRWDKRRELWRVDSHYHTYRRGGGWRRIAKLSENGRSSLLLWRCKGSFGDGENGRM